MNNKQNKRNKPKLLEALFLLPLAVISSPLVERIASAVLIFAFLFITYIAFGLSCGGA